MKFTNLFTALVLGGAALASVKCGDAPIGDPPAGTKITVHKNPDGGTEPVGGEGGGTQGW